MPSDNGKSRKELRKKFALERQEETSKRTPQEQLKRLDLKFGKDCGAVKERAKLNKKIGERNE